MTVDPYDLYAAAAVVEVRSRTAPAMRGLVARLRRAADSLAATETTPSATPDVIGAQNADERTTP